jgi:hypothetical protein
VLRFSQNVSTPIPIGLAIPIPVITTSRFDVGWFIFSQSVAGTFIAATQGFRSLNQSREVWVPGRKASAGDGSRRTIIGESNFSGFATQATKAEQLH